jgi:hypothetical protein
MIKSIHFKHKDTNKKVFIRFEKGIRYFTVLVNNITFICSCLRDALLTFQLEYFKLVKNDYTVRKVIKF